MSKEGQIIGIIIAFELDRDGNDFVIRGSLNFFDKPLIKITNEILEHAGIYNNLIYTFQKGIIFRNILGKSAKYIVRKNNYLYTSNNLYMDFSESLLDFNHIIIIDPKYPLLDDSLITNLISKHLDNKSTITYIKGLYKDSFVIPNIFIVEKSFFIDFISNEFHPKSINVGTMIDTARFLQKEISFIETNYISKVLAISNGKRLSYLEALLLNRK